MGFIDKTGKVVIDFQYEIGSNGFKNGLARVIKLGSINRDDGEQGYIDKAGNLVLDFKRDYYAHVEDIYGYTDHYSDGLILVNDYNNKKSLYIDQSGNVIIDVSSKYGTYATFTFSEGLTPINNNDKGIGFIDNKGNVVIDFKYHSARPCSEGLMAVKLDNKWGYINKKGELIIDYKYDEVKEFSEGYAAVAKEIKNSNGFTDTYWGFIDKEGNEVVECKYSTVNKFSNGLALVKKGNIGAYIDTKGNVVIGRLD